ncbi:TRAP transporter substrate-binding protein DctP [Variovorax terrae]|uniref:TRAP transporter substrate-binding protein DctP n=1 Tax=Variovorax terrae TaxID=2923278 RepID=A0A9X2APC5_9BURK|nr:TRAP transporter substrate-binding protein DctP [Variovorax terrae]MCJ0764735.1 TRAP transporter substrate-binding protein DctP [Variovorax terrae]
MKRRSLIQLATASVASVALPRYAFAQNAYKAEYKMSTVVPPAFAWGKGGEIFANLVRERTSGRINIKQYPGASLVQGQQDREFSAMRQGIIDVLCGAPINWSGTVRELSAFTLPFLLPDHKAYDAVINNAPLMAEYFSMVRKAGAEPLAVGETGYRQISNSKHPIIKPDDLKGIKVRVVGSPMYGEIMSSMGGNPTFMSWADAQPALASGAVDAQENPLEVFLAAKVNTLGQKYVTKWNYSNDILLYAIAAPVWAGWTPADQKIVREAAQDAAKQQIAIVRKLFADDVQAVSALGVNVHVPTPPEIEAWQTATRRTYARWKAQIQPAFIGKIEQIVAASRKA